MDSVVHPNQGEELPQAGAQRDASALVFWQPTAFHCVGAQIGQQEAWVRPSLGEPRPLQCQQFDTADALTAAPLQRRSAVRCFPQAPIYKYLICGGVPPLLSAGCEKPSSCEGG